MKTRTAMTSVFCFCAFTIASILLISAPAGAGLEAKLPADTLLYAHWAGRSLTFDGSQFGQMLQQDAMLDILKAAFSKGFSQNVGTSQKTATAILKLIDISWQRPITVGLAGLSKKTGVQRADLFIDLGKDKPEFEKVLNELLAIMLEEFMSGKMPDPVQFGNGSYTLFPMVELKAGKTTTGKKIVAYGFSGEMFFITLGQAKAQAEALLSGKTGPGLDTNKKFVASMKAVAGPDTQAAIYIDVESILTQAEAMLPPQRGPATKPAGAEKAPANMSVLRKITNALGVEKLTTIAGTIRIVDKGMLSKLRIFSPAPHRGILLPLAGTPLSKADIAAIPADADFAIALNLDPAKLLAESLRIASGIFPKAGGMINGGLKMLGAPLGISIEKDIINNLGDTWMLSTAESQGGLLTGTIISVEIKDPKAFGQTIAKIEASVSRMLAGPASRPARAGNRSQPSRSQLSKPRPGLEKIVVNDIEIHYLRMPRRGAGVVFLPAWAIHKNRLYVALWPQVIASTLTNKTPSLAATPAFKKLRSRVAGKASMLSYVNTPQVAKRLYPIQLILGTAMSNGILQALPGCELPMMPDTIENVLKLLQPEIGVISHDAAGITIEGFGSSPSAAAAVPAVAGGAAIMLPALNRARFLARKTVSMSNLRQLGHACAWYSNDYDGRMATNFEQLMPYLLDKDTKVFVSPISANRPPRLDEKSKKLVGPIDYVLVHYAPKTLHDIRKPSQAILIYEDPANYQNTGTHVAFVDGHVEWVDMPTFKKLHTKALKAGGKEVPAGWPGSRR